MLASRHPWLPHPGGGRVDLRAAARPATAARAGDEHEERPISDDKPRGGLLSRLRGRGSDDRPDPAADRGSAPEDETASSASDPSDEGSWVHHDGSDGHEGWLYHYADGTIVDADGTVYELTGDEPAAAAGHDDPAKAERERAEREQAAQEAARERAEKEQAERDRAEQAEREQAEREQAEREEAERQRAEQEEAARAERERAEAERVERERAERERAERERAERERAEKAEREKSEREKAEREKAERERVGQEERSAPAEGAAATAATIAAAGSDTDDRPTEEAHGDGAEDERPADDQTQEAATPARDDDSRGEADEATTDEPAPAEDERPTATEKSTEEAPTEAREAPRTASVPSFVEYSPSEAPRYGLGAVAALAAVGAVLVGFSAVADSSGSDLVLAAVLALVAAAALWLLERWSSTVVTVRDSTLEVERRGSTDTFDLRDPDLAVDLDEDQRSPSWSATFTEPEGERVTLRRTHVKVAQFVAIVEHHRSHLHERD